MKYINKIIFIFVATLALISNAAETQNIIKITLFSVSTGKSVGYVDAQDSPKGVIITPHLYDLPPGMHGMHIHEFPSCENKAMAAGEHWDPKQTMTHEGPYKNGHLGDLPLLEVKNDGKADTAVIAPHLTVADLEGHSLMIHAGGDNYSDNPPLGGGGARIACGVIS